MPSDAEDTMSQQQQPTTITNPFPTGDGAEPISVRGKHLRVTLPAVDGEPRVTAAVRRLARYEQRDLVARCRNPDPNSVGFQVEFAELVVRAAVEHVDGPIRDEHGSTINPRPRREDRHGPALMPRELYDALGDSAVAEIVAFALSGLTETQQKH
jgi:hypothetical protein